MRFPDHISRVRLSELLNQLTNHNHAMRVRIIGPASHEGYSCVAGGFDISSVSQTLLFAGTYLQERLRDLVDDIGEACALLIIQIDEVADRKLSGADGPEDLAFRVVVA